MCFVTLGEISLSHENLSHFTSDRSFLKLLSFHSEVSDSVRLPDQFAKTTLSIEGCSAEGTAALDSVPDTDLRELFDVAQVLYCK